MTKTKHTPPQISWHRGGAEVAPHATRNAFVHALRSKAELVEIDVREMADGELVCVHDTELAGIGILGQVAYGDLTAEQRSEIYTLEEFVADLVALDPGGSTTVHFDLKEIGHELRAVDALIAKRRPFFVTTLERSSVRLLRKQRPEEKSLLTIGRLSTSKSRLRRSLHRFRELFPFVDLASTHASGIAIHVQLAKPWTLWWCKRRNLMVVVWTIDGTKNLQTWLNSEVDAITTNRPLKALALRERLSAP